MSDHVSAIHQFTGADYAGWAYKVRYGLMEKDLYSCVFEFRGEARVPCPVLITLLTQAKLDSYPRGTNMAEVQRDNNAAHRSSKIAFDAWMLMDMKAQAFIVKYLGASEHTHTRHCE